MKARPWWQNFQILGYVVAGLAALGTVIVVSNKYIVLPQRVEAAENDIKDLKGWAQEIQGYTRATQQLQMNQSNQRAPQVWMERTVDGDSYCTDGRESWWPTQEGRCE